MSDERPTISFTAPPPRPGIASPTAETVLDLSVPHEPSVVAAAVEDVDAHEAARMLNQLPADQAGAIVPLLEPQRKARIVAEMDAGRAARILESMPVEEATAVLSAMDPDDRVDILDELPGDKHDELVAGLDAEDRAEVLELEKYEPDSAGGIMTTEVTYLYRHLTVGNAIDQLRRFHEELEQMFYVYVIDSRHHLVGVLSMRDLILARPEQRLREIMIPRDRVRALPADMDQEEVAELFRRYHYLAMPVVDRQDRLVGLVTVDDVVDVLQEETTEDVHKLFGAGAEEKLTSPWFYSFRMRIGWLVVNLATAFAAAAVVAAFSGMIDQLPILAVFMPIIAGMGGNASAQAMAVAVRGLSTGRVDRRLIRHVILREFWCGLLTGLIIGAITAVIAYLYYTGRAQGNAWQAVGLGTIVFAALLVNHSLASVTGAGVPFLMKRLGFDPAQSATIFATTITDVVGFFALLGLAAVTAKQFGLL
jgi:magnesium transporter